MVIVVKKTQEEKRNTREGKRNKRVRNKKKNILFDFSSSLSLRDAKETRKKNHFILWQAPSDFTWIKYCDLILFHFVFVLCKILIFQDQLLSKLKENIILFQTRTKNKPNPTYSKEKIHNSSSHCHSSKFISEFVNPAWIKARGWASYKHFSFPAYLLPIFYF